MRQIAVARVRTLWEMWPPIRCKARLTVTVSRRRASGRAEPVRDQIFRSISEPFKRWLAMRQRGSAEDGSNPSDSTTALKWIWFYGNMGNEDDGRDSR
jgi:hypothetical protein